VSVLIPDLRGAFTAWGPLYRCDQSNSIEQEAELVSYFLIQRIEAYTGDTFEEASRKSGVSQFPHLLSGPPGVM
jgi:hypothetical protein